MNRLILALVLATGFSGPLSAAVQVSGYYSTPSIKGPADFVKAIDQSKSSIRMWMFTMNNRVVIDSLVAAAQRGVKVQLILNNQMVAKAPAMVTKLRDGGVTVISSSTGFTISHAKTAVFDEAFALITTMNLTSAFRLTRDAGLKVIDSVVLQDLHNLFDADLANAKTNGDSTPLGRSLDLVIGPRNALPRLLSFIDSAQHEILATVENFSPGPISDHLLEAAKRGVTVKLIAPFCSLNEDPFFNFRVLDILAKGSVSIRVLPSPATAEAPYMHQKMMLVDNERAFYGSENFTFNSLRKAREIGLIFDAKPVLKEILADFNSDWKAATSLPPGPAAKCTVFGKQSLH